MLNTSLDVYDKAKIAVTTPIKASGVLSFSGGVSAKANVEAAPQPKPVNDEAITQAVQKLNDHIAAAQQSVQFSVDKDTNRTVVKVVDTATNKVLRQMPNEEALAMSKALGKLQGLMINKTA